MFSQIEGHQMNVENTVTPLPADDLRLPYEQPELVDLGGITDLTEGVTCNPGGDGAYS
jgi:hypothetical protein